MLGHCYSHPDVALYALKRFYSFHLTIFFQEEVEGYLMVKRRTGGITEVKVNM